jgi:site-specific DNA recombinase
VESVTKSTIKCAIYTRKSSEEGLDQSFNSLAAQREACRSFVLSQKHEGWTAIKDAYDDGGISGGTMERPALQQLLKDIKSGSVNTVVVYKVDRLTRSLTDFAKIIEIFDSHSVSFVSVTQQFNTTSSMGRLTLNVLLSFAQFEREITGERIRDKIAASKRKGMWMCGRVPLGYDCINRELVVNASEAETVREIFHSYLRLGCLSRLKKHLDRINVRSGIRTSMAGKKYGGASYSRGALHHLLSNRIYVGEIVHGAQHFSGQHEAIIADQLWNQVSSRLAKNNNGRRAEGAGSSGSLLCGILFDATGVRFTPTHSLKRGKRYRYYTSQAVIQNPDAKPQIARIPALEIENLVIEQVHHFLGAPDPFLKQIRDGSDRDVVSRHIALAAKGWAGRNRIQIHESIRRIVSRVALGQSKLWIEIHARNVLEYLRIPAGGTANTITTRGKVLKLEADFQIFRGGSATRMVIPNHRQNPNAPVSSIVKAVARAREWYEGFVRGDFNTLEDIATATQLTQPYVRKVLACAFLCPSVAEALLDGRHAPDLTLKNLLNEIPNAWLDQEASILSKLR